MSKTISKKKFAPTIRTEKKLNLKGFHQLDSLKEKNGTIISKINQESAVQALSTKLYRNAESGFRELLNNEVRACQIAKDKYGSKNPYIKVSLDTTDRSLIIHGINSQGITIEVLDVLREIGQSITESKKGGRIPFGMGFYGSLKLSDIVQVQTRCIENKDCYGVQLRGGLFFEEIQAPTFKETGTAIKVTLKPKTNYEKIIETLVDVSKTSGVKTYFELKAHNGDIANFPSGIHELGSTSIRKIFDETKEDDGFSYLTASIDNNEVEAYLSIAIGSSGNLQNNRNKKLFLVNSPIEAVVDEKDFDDYDYEAKNADDDDNNDDDYNYDDDDEDEKHTIKYQASKIDEINFHSVVVNMKKESIFPAMQDRERLDKRAEKKLREIIVQLYNDALKTIKPCHTLAEWFDHEHKYFISSNKNQLIDLDKSLDQETIKLQTLLNTEVFTYKEETLRESEIRELKYQLDSYYTNKNNIRLFYALKKDKRIFNILKDNYGQYKMKDEDQTPYFLCLIDPTKFRKESDDDNNYHHTLTPKQYGIKVKKVETKIKKTKTILEYFGFVDAKQYIKEKGLKRIYSDEELPKEVVVDTTTYVTLHNFEYTGLHDSVSIEDALLEEDLIKIKDFAKYQKIIKQFENHEICLVIDDPDIEELSDITTTSDIYKEIKNKKFLTNFGNLTVEEILQNFKRSTEIILNPTIEDEEFKLINRVPKVSEKDKRCPLLYIIGNNSRKKLQDKVVNGHKVRLHKGSRSFKQVSKDITDHSDYFKLALVLIDNKRKYTTLISDDDKDDLKEYYKDSLETLQKNLDELIGFEDSYKDDDITDASFDSIEDFEQYLFSLKDLHEKIRNQTLRKFFKTGHDQHDYKEVIKEVLTLNKLITPNRINRKTTKEYL